MEINHLQKSLVKSCFFITLLTSLDLMYGRKGEDNYQHSNAQTWSITLFCSFCALLEHVGQ